MKQASLEIKGMSCEHCVRQIREEVTSVVGVKTADVVMGSAQVQFDESRCSISDLVSAIHALGRFQISSFSTQEPAT